MASEMDIGIIYVAVHDLRDKYRAWAERSIISLREYMPDMPAILYTDDKNMESNHFKMCHVSLDPKLIMLAKIDACIASPYNRTLYLDADTLVCDDLSDVMGPLLDRFDVGYVHNSFRNPRPLGCPDCFAQPHGAFLAFRKSEATRRFLHLWRHYFLDLFRMRLGGSTRHGWGDQESLQLAVWDTRGLRPMVLPNEYLTTMEGGYAALKIKVLHGRTKLAGLAAVLNEHIRPRFHHRGKIIAVSKGRSRLKMAVTEAKLSEFRREI